jgi:hypothetical protein
MSNGERKRVEERSRSTTDNTAERLERALEHQRERALSEQQLARALGIADQGLRQRRLRLKKDAKRSRAPLPISYVIHGQRWTLIEEIERAYPQIVELTGGAYDPGNETKEEWISRWASFHAAFARPKG